MEYKQMYCNINQKQNKDRIGGTWKNGISVKFWN